MSIQLLAVAATQYDCRYRAPQFAFFGSTTKRSQSSCCVVCCCCFHHSYSWRQAAIEWQKKWRSCHFKTGCHCTATVEQTTAHLPNCCRSARGSSEQERNGVTNNTRRTAIVVIIVTSTVAATTNSNENSTCTCCFRQHHPTANRIGPKAVLGHSRHQDMRGRASLQAIGEECRGSQHTGVNSKRQPHDRHVVSHSIRLGHPGQLQSGHGLDSLPALQRPWQDPNHRQIPAALLRQEAESHGCEHPQRHGKIEELDEQEGANTAVYADADGGEHAVMHLPRAVLC
mmetsp:Transcript_15758/g.44194  ORF Transcript_15758/g.44194 Transcript_15758/m.44194 type:complete len:285 (-) Transcript_15758:382-1236(-)